jgi:tetratricopeptide (TPR) repeat protein
VGVITTGRVFISHTSDMAQVPEGRSFVQAAVDGVIRAGMVPVDMRYFPAGEARPADYCREQVRGCGIFVAVVGFRYGSMVPGEGVSFTELELDEATGTGLPRLVFVLEDSPGMTLGMADAERGAAEGFRQRVRDAGLVICSFSSADGLELAVFQALTGLVGRGSAAPGMALEVRHSLPPDTAAFTGRDEELGRIAAAVGEAAGAGRVVAIDGMPGVGKTALAVHVAHLLQDRFADRQLFIDLHAHTPGRGPVRPDAALAGLLAAVGVDARQLPEDLEGRAGLWRDRMAGQRAVLVFDNTASSAQIAPLLPGDEGCLVLVTSRRHLGDLPGPVIPVQVSALPPDKAQAMLARLAGRAADPAAVAELAGLAGYLPLAISLLARVYARHPSWTLADLAAETRASLLTLAAENDSIAAAFEVSYRYLVPRQQQFLRRLGLHPGTTIDAYGAAALAGTGLPEAGRLLDALHRESLLTEIGYRRYGMHDLIRRYARDRAAGDPAADRDQALERLLDYYQHTAALAEARLARRTRTKPTSASACPPAAVPDLPDSAQALAWARAERASLLACLDHVTNVGQHARIVALTAGMAALLRHDGPWADAITRHAAAVQAARHLGDRLGQANALHDLGAAQELIDDYPGAARAEEEALGIYRDLGDRLGQANALSQLGDVRHMTGDYPGAARAEEEALGIYRDLGDRLGQASALSQLGDVRRQTGDYPGAAAALEDALGIYRDLDHRVGQANALLYLGVMRRLTGDYPGAAGVQEEALGICRDLGHRVGQANALNELGIVRQLTGDYPGAAAALEDALGIYRDLGDRIGQANALLYFGVVRRLTGDYPGAARTLKDALGIFRDLGERGAEAEVLNEEGTLYRVRDDLDQAQRYHRQALDLARETGSPWDEAQALAGLGRCAQATDRTADAAAYLRQAQEIFRRIGAAEASGVAAELDALTKAEPTA